MNELIRKRHPAADALDWNEAMSLIKSLIRDERAREAMLIACGCYLGLRISDILKLKWDDFAHGQTISMIEKKTGKERVMKINPNLTKIAGKCKEMVNPQSDNAYIFCTQMHSGMFPMTRQRASQLLNECKETYNIKTAKNFSTHSLRKTFGRRVWLQQCEKGKGEQALILLQDVFGHSSVSITRRYLGIRQDEILSVYDQLD